MVTSICYTKSLSLVDAQTSTLESSSVFTSESGETVSVYENGDSSDRSSITVEAFPESGPINVQSSRDIKTIPQSVCIVYCDRKYIYIYGRTVIIKLWHCLTACSRIDL